MTRTGIAYYNSITFHFIGNGSTNIQLATELFGKKATSSTSLASRCGKLLSSDRGEINESVFGVFPVNHHHKQLASTLPPPSSPPFLSPSFLSPHASFCGLKYKPCSIFQKECCNT